MRNAASRLFARAAVLGAALAAFAGPAPARAEDAQFDFCAGNQADPKNYVLLLENNTNPLRMFELRDRLIGCGWPANKVVMKSIPLPLAFINDCTEDIAEIWIQSRVNDSFADNGNERIDVVAYSEQAMTLRWYMSALNGHQKVRRLVLWGSPNNGSDNLAGQGGIPFCYLEQLRETDPFVGCINGETPGAPGCGNPSTSATPFAIAEGEPAANGVLWVNIWSEEDLLIDPDEAILKDGGINIEIPAVPHGLYPDDDYVLKTTIAAITGAIIDPGKPDPGGLCGALPGASGGPSALLAALAMLVPAGFLLRRARRAARK